MVLAFKEKSEGSANLSVFTRRRLVKGNPNTWGEEQSAGVAQKGTFLPGGCVAALGQLSRVPSQQKLSHPSPEIDGAAVQPLLFLTAGRKECGIYTEHLLTAHREGPDTNWF